MYLLDTHIVLWWLEDNPQLPKNIKTLLSNTQKQVFVSAVSIWEIVVKQSLKKIIIPKNFFQALEAQNFEKLPITWEHAQVVGDLPDIHKDPFDRLLLAQAISEKLILVTRDEFIKQYPDVILYD